MLYVLATWIAKAVISFTGIGILIELAKQIGISTKPERGRDNEISITDRMLRSVALVFAFIVVSYLYYIFDYGHIDSVTTGFRYTIEHIESALGLSANAGRATEQGTPARFEGPDGKLTTLHIFRGRNDGKYPSAGLAQGLDGNLYGTTSRVGISDFGTVFKYDTLNDSFSTIYKFKSNSDGASPAGRLLYKDHILYGVTSEGGVSGIRNDQNGTGTGTIYALNPQTQQKMLVHSFRTNYSYGASIELPLNQQPNTGVVSDDVYFYGTASRVGNVSPNGFHGGVYKIDKTIDDGGDRNLDPSGHTKAPGNELALHIFSDDREPGPPSTELLYYNGYLYGLTLNSVRSGASTLFKIDAADGTLTELHRFTDGAHDSQASSGWLVLNGQDIYGATANGGDSDAGVVFSFDIRTNIYRALYSFKAGKDGKNPNCGLVLRGENLYGTTVRGGTSNLGTIFEVNIRTGVHMVLYSFAGGADGARPFAGLAPGYAGPRGLILYGTTVNGGAFQEREFQDDEKAEKTYGSGTLFSFETAM
jgi:uncharacterized repeat protein (TIGR03803 family)